VDGARPLHVLQHSRARTHAAHPPDTYWLADKHPLFGVDPVLATMVAEVHPARRARPASVALALGGAGIGVNTPDVPAWRAERDEGVRAPSFDAELRPQPACASDTRTPPLHAPAASRAASVTTPRNASAAGSSSIAR